MRKVFSFLITMVLAGIPTLLAAPTTRAADRDSKANKRLENSGEVIKEILDIPADLLDKAECVIVIPSVIKVAFGISGSYGAGAMTCRSGEDFTGPWGAP